MTNEEKKAIEKLINTSKQCHNSKECWENEDCTDCYVEVEDIMAIDTVLKLLKEQDNRIKELESDKEIKNKIIDRMAEYINKLDIDEDICTKNIINPELCNEQYSNCKECIKQYFENLAKESGEIDEDKSN